MKKFTLLSLFAIFALGFSASAQIQKGNVLVGTDFAGLGFTLNTPNTFTLNITPKAAWFIADNVALGGYINLDLATAKGLGTTTDYGIGALGRYYAGTGSDMVRHTRFFFEANAGLGGVDVSNGGGNTNGFQFGVGPGVAYFVTPNIGLETLAKFNGTTGFGGAGFQSTLTLNFGLQVYLPGQRTLNKVKSDVK